MNICKRPRLHVCRYGDLQICDLPQLHIWLVTIQNPNMRHFVKPVKPLQKKSTVSEFHIALDVYQIKRIKRCQAGASFVKRAYILPKVIEQHVFQKVLVHSALN